MTRLSYAFLSAPVLIISNPATAQNADLPAVTAHLKAVTSMTASFAQTDRAGKTLTGALTLKRPGKIRFQYQKDVPILMVSNGKTLTFIDYSVRQVQSWPIGNSPLGILLDPEKNIARYARQIASKDPKFVLVQAKDPKRPEFGTITLAFSRDAGAPAGLMLHGWIAVDAQNNRTELRLSNQRFNVAVSDEAFKWRDPRQAGPHR